VNINIINNINALQVKDLVIRKETEKEAEISNQNSKGQIENKGIKHLQLRLENTIKRQDKTIP
jgi:hypothetical protein